MMSAFGAVVLESYVAAVGAVTPPLCPLLNVVDPGTNCSFLGSPLQ